MSKRTTTRVTGLELSYRRLTVWTRAVELVGVVAKKPLGDAELRSQAKRAATSVGLNIAEGAGHRGAMRAKHFRVARASAAEVAAAYDLAEALGELAPAEQVADLANQLAAMLTALIRK